MFCEKCGSKIPNGSIFCTSCGAKLGKKGQQVPPTQNDAQNELAKAHLDAASVIDAANAEAAKIAKEYKGDIKASQEAFSNIAAGEAELVVSENINAANNAVTGDLAGSNDASEAAGSSLEDADNKTTSDGNALIVSEKNENEALNALENSTGIALQSTDDSQQTAAGESFLPIESTAITETAGRQEEKNDQRPLGSEIKQGKSIPAGLIIVATLGLVVLVIALVFILSGSARNGIKRMFMSDENYFKSVEKNAISDLVDNIGDAYEDDFVGFFDFMKSEYALTVEVDVKDEAEDFLESIYKKNRDLDLSWIKKAYAEATFKMRDKMLQLDGEASINKKDLFSFDMIGNFTDEKFYVGIPILSKEYAKFDFSNALYGEDSGSVGVAVENADTEADANGGNKTDSAAGDISNPLLKLIESDAFQKALPSKKELTRLVEKYLDIALNKVKKIKFREDQKLEAAGVKERYLLITVDLDEVAQADIYDAILKELSKDDDVLAIINRMEKTEVFGGKVSADAFLDWIEKEQNEVYERPYPFRTLNIWVDDTGKVVGQELVDTAGTGWTYKYVINGDNFGFEAYEANRGRAVQNIYASGTISGSVVTGNVKYYKNGSEKLSLNFTDIDVIDVMQGTPTGSLVLDVYDMLGDRQYRDMKLNVEFNLSLKKSTVKVMLADAGKTIIEADITLKKSSAGKIKEPSKVLDIDKNNNILSWIKNFDWDDILKNADKANMPSRYYRQLEKWSESDLSGEIDKINEIIRKYSIRSMTETDLYGGLFE